MANEKSKAEQYRDERKARIAKSAKKNAPKLEKANTARKLAGKIISIVLAVVIGLGVIGLVLNYYGVPQRVLTIGGVGSDQKVTVAEYQYYYMRTYNNLVSQVQQYSQYGYDYGYDISLAPDKQTKTTQDADGNEITWAEMLHDETIKLAQTYKAYYNEALKKDIKFTKADEVTVQQTIDSYKESAESAGSGSTDGSTGRQYSLNAYLRKVFGNGVNKSFLKKEIKIQLMAQKYYQVRSDELAAGYEQTEIDKAYKEAKDTYDLVTARVYAFSNETLSANDGESDDALKARQTKSDAKTKADAQAFFKAVTDEASFITKAEALNKDTEDYDVATTRVNAVKSTFEQNFSSDVASWLFDSARKVGEKKLITDEEGGRYFIVLITKGAHQEETVNVRHILFSTVDNSSGEALSAEEVAKAKKNAEDALKKFNDGDKTEDSFAALATELTEDTGSSSTGGLYENVIPGQMVKEFNDWIFDANRKEGDVEIVETQYGYHVIYFVSKGGAYYDATIRNSKAQEDIEAESNELLDGETYEVGFGPRRLDYAEKGVLKKINKLIEISNANASASASAGNGQYSY